MISFMIDLKFDVNNKWIDVQWVPYLDKYMRSYRLFSDLLKIRLDLSFTIDTYDMNTYYYERLK